METAEIIKSLREISNMRSTSNYKRTICKMAAQRLEKLTAELKQDDRRWIPVTERLPEEGGFVLAYNGTVEKGYLLDGEWSALGFVLQHMHGVSHWMPLPESPKEDVP